MPHPVATTTPSPPPQSWQMPCAQVSSSPINLQSPKLCPRPPALHSLPIFYLFIPHFFPFFLTICCSLPVFTVWRATVLPSRSVTSPHRCQLGLHPRSVVTCRCWDTLICLVCLSRLLPSYSLRFLNSIFCLIIAKFQLVGASLVVHRQERELKWGWIQAIYGLCSRAFLSFYGLIGCNQNLCGTERHKEGVGKKGGRKTQVEGIPQAGLSLLWVRCH